MPIHPATLGATLYVPATRADLPAIAAGARYPGLRSVIFCLEDAVRETDIAPALDNLHALFAQLRATPERAGPHLFIRPRHPDMLARIVAMGASVDGYVIPKATADTLPAWLAALPADHSWLMPTIETREAFDPAEMRRLRAQLIAVQDRVLAVRIGGNDLLQTLGARRSAVRTAYDGPLGAIVASLVSTFVPWGFAMSAPVSENFADADLLRDEIERDLEHGLVTKTAIHPAQVEIIHAAYRVPEDDWREARDIVADDAPAVFANAGVMCEPSTHRAWAAATLRRAELFGVIAREGPALSLVG